MVGDAQDLKRWKRYDEYIRAARNYERRAVEARTVEERREAAASTRLFWALATHEVA